MGVVVVKRRRKQRRGKVLASLLGALTEVMQEFVVFVAFLEVFRLYEIKLISAEVVGA